MPAAQPLTKWSPAFSDAGSIKYGYGDFEVTKYTPESVLAAWVKEFHLCGDFPNQVKIMFDGHAENEDGSEDTSQFCYAVFVHKDSGAEDFNFPEHDNFGRLVINRSDEEVCYSVWVNEEGDLDVICEPETDLDIKHFEKIIVDIERKYQESI